MRASRVPGGAGTISGIASTTCGGDHVRVRRACLRCPDPLLPGTALLFKRIKGDSVAGVTGSSSAQSHRRCGDPRGAAPGVGWEETANPALRCPPTVRTAAKAGRVTSRPLISWSTPQACSKHWPLR
jgi:hypothetical protein